MRTVDAAADIAVTATVRVAFSTGLQDGAMRVLVLGGTAFVGRAVVETALGQGASVTTFNRGVTGADVDGVQAVHGDRYDDDAIAELVRRGPWDAIVDCAGFVPRNVLAVARALEPVAHRYVFVSTVSVYADWPVRPLSEESEVLACPPDAGPGYGTDTENGPTQYGYQKAGCEAAARLAFGEDRTVLLRPGVVLGPREYVGRLPWWLRRIAAGGPVIAPGSPDRYIQPVDVRDLAEFALHGAKDGLAGAYNVAGPIGRDTFAGFLASCVEVTGSDARLLWAPDAELQRAGVRQWSEMPLWRTFEGTWNVNASRAAGAGLRSRPLAATVRDTWEWMQAGGAADLDARAQEIGLRPEHEAALLAALGG